MRSEYWWAILIFGALKLSYGDYCDDQCDVGAGAACLAIAAVTAVFEKVVYGNRRSLA